MSEIDILEEIARIQKKYINVMESTGTIAMSTVDKQRIAFLEEELRKLRGYA